MFDPAYCSGCMRCMTTCSTYTTGATSLSSSRIHIMRHEGHAVSCIDEEDDLIFTLIACQQCDNPPCAKLCPTKAIAKDEETGVVAIDHDQCMGCRLCLINCPFGAISYDERRKRLIKCDLCGGDPQCVRLCPTGALQFLPKNRAHLGKRDLLARNMVRSRTRAMALREDMHASS